jgi:hypothetical protein
LIVGVLNIRPVPCRSFAVVRRLATGQALDDTVLD